MSILPPVGMDGMEAKELGFFNIVEALVPVCFWPEKHTHKRRVGSDMYHLTEQTNIGCSI